MLYVEVQSLQFQFNLAAKFARKRLKIEQQIINNKYTILTMYNT